MTQLHSQIPLPPSHFITFKNHPSIFLLCFSDPPTCFSLLPLLTKCPFDLDKSFVLSRNFLLFFTHCCYRCLLLPLHPSSLLAKLLPPLTCRLHCFTTPMDGFSTVLDWLVTLPHSPPSSPANAVLVVVRSSLQKAQLWFSETRSSWTSCSGDARERCLRMSLQCVRSKSSQKRNRTTP